MTPEDAEKKLKCTDAKPERFTVEQWFALSLRDRDRLVAERILGYERDGCSYIYDNPQGEPCYSQVTEWGGRLRPIERLVGAPPHGVLPHLRAYLAGAVGAVLMLLGIITAMPLMLTHGRAFDAWIDWLEGLIRKMGGQPQ